MLKSTKNNKRKIQSERKKRNVCAKRLRNSNNCKELGKILENANIESIVKYIQSGECKNIITMAGAGISTSAGIPDFRSPGSGLYDNLEKYKLPSPMAIFEIDYFRRRPEAFFALAKELYPGSFKPTLCHYFIKLLHRKNLLLRHFTQNIDNLERIAGLPDEVLVEAHGSFHLSHCLTCRQEYSLAWMKERIFSDVIPSCDECNGLVKPDIVFFGENLPSRYFHRTDTDFPRADLLLIMGTSLVVQPFCSLVNNAPPDCPRLLINKEKVGTGPQNPLMGLLRLPGDGLAFDSEANVRDVFLQGDCDSGCQTLANMLGWGEELKQLVREEHARLDLEMRGEGTPGGEESGEEDTENRQRRNSREDEPREQAEADTPCEKAKVDNPCENTKVDKPCEKATVDKPCEKKEDALFQNIEVDKSSEKAKVDNPCEKAKVDKPFEKTTVDKPCEKKEDALFKKTEVDKSCEKAKVDQPCLKPQVDEPCENKKDAFCEKTEVDKSSENASFDNAEKKTEGSVKDNPNDKVGKL